MILKPQRKTIRLKHYNYSDIGLYFVTICIQNKKCLFGHIKNNQMVLNQAGKMVEFWYFEIHQHFQNVCCLDYIIMPNHIHFILYIEESNHSLFSIIQWFKTMTTNHYIKCVKDEDWLPFEKKLWQRSYYEHIIRNEKSYLEICDYIENNPYLWHSDVLYQP